MAFFSKEYVLNATPKYDTAYKDAVMRCIVPTHTLAIVTEDCSLHSEPGFYSRVEHKLKKGATVELLQDSSEKWYRVESGDEGASGWVSVKFLEIKEEDAIMPSEMTDEYIEAFANIMRFPTKSGYFIWTDVARQLTHILKKSDATGEYELLKTFLCATGRSATPTTRGFFTITDRGKWFYSKRFQSGGMFWVRFNGTYLFHSIAFNRNKEVIDDVLGERRSNGCVRLSVSDAEWIYENIPDGTSVFIH